LDIAINGYEEVVKMLLGWEEANLVRPDNHGRTALMENPMTGHEGVVRVLLEWPESTPEKPDIDS